MVVGVDGMLLIGDELSGEGRSLAESPSRWVSLAT